MNDPILPDKEQVIEAAPRREKAERPSLLRLLPRRTPAQLLIRLIASYLCTMATPLLETPGLKMDNKEFGPSLSSILLGVIGTFLLFSLVDLLLSRFLASDGWFLAGAVATYGTVFAFRANDTMSAVVMALLACFAVAYLAHKELLPLPAVGNSEDGQIPRWLAITLVSLCFAFSAIYIGTVTVIRYLTYVSPNFDFGIFVNMYHNMATTGLPNTTCERDGFLSHFAVHFSPIYYLLLPLYMLFPSGITLQIGQALICASGVFPLYRIARRAGLSRLSGAGLCAVYVLYPALSGSCMYDIHENCFLTPLLLWTFDFALRGNRLLTLLFALLTCLVKEDAPVYIAFLGIYLLCSGKERRDKLFGGGVLTMGILYFLGVSAYLEAFGQGIMAWRYSDYSADGGLVSVILTVIRHPGIVLHHIADGEKLKYIFQTLAPLCFLPFMTVKPSRLILLGPYILINLMPSYQYQHDIYFQYNYGTFAFLMLAVVLNLADFEPKKRRVALPCALMASLILFSGTTYTAKHYYFASYAISEPLREKMEQAIDIIPEDASLASSTFILAHVAYRSEIYPMNTVHLDKCEYAIVDLRYGREIKNNTYKLDYLWLRNHGWEELLFTEGTVAVYRNPDYAGGN